MALTSDVGQVSSQEMGLAIQGFVCRSSAGECL